MSRGRDARRRQQRQAEARTSREVARPEPTPESDKRPAGNMQKSELRALVRKEVHDSVSEVVTEVVTASAWSAPIPHPDDFAGYEAVVPGGAKAILDTFTEQSRHRREAEALVVRGSERRADRGQLLVFGLIAALILVGAFLAFLVDPWAGVAAMGLGFGGGVWVYIVGGRPPSERPPTPADRDTGS